MPVQVANQVFKVCVCMCVCVCVLSLWFAASSSIRDTAATTPHNTQVHMGRHDEGSRSLQDPLGGTRPAIVRHPVPPLCRRGSEASCIPRA